MNLLAARDTRMPFGEHKGKTLGAIFASDASYLTDFLLPRADTLDAWLREAVELVVSDGVGGPSAEAEGQGQLFG